MTASNALATHLEATIAGLYLCDYLELRGRSSGGFTIRPLGFPIVNRNFRISRPERAPGCQEVTWQTNVELKLACCVFLALLLMWSNPRPRIARGGRASITY